MIRKGLIVVFLLSFLVGYSKDTTYVCIDDSTHNFFVQPQINSFYDWKLVNETNGIANIVSGNGSENIFIDLNKTGIFRVIVTETDSNGCLGIDSLLVKVVPNPSPKISSIDGTSACEGDSINLILDSNYNDIVWNNGNTTSSIYVSRTGIYNSSVTNKYGCSALSNSISIVINELPKSDFSFTGNCVNSLTTFINTSISIDSISVLEWEIESSKYNEEILEYTFTSTGNYDVKLYVETKNGCKDRVTRNIEILNNPVAQYSFYTTNPIDNDSIVYFTNLSQNGVNFTWDFGDSSSSSSENPSHTYQNSGVYNVQLTVIDANMCVDSIVKQIAIKLNFDFYLPNSFTPDGNSLNDSFGPVGKLLEKCTNYEFSIYNRWGERVFFTNDIKMRWNGEKAQDGYYIWTISLDDELGNNIKESGEVKILK